MQVNWWKTEDNPARLGGYWTHQNETVEIMSLITLCNQCLEEYKIFPGMLLHVEKNQSFFRVLSIKQNEKPQIDFGSMRSSPSPPSKSLTISSECIINAPFKSSPPIDIQNGGSRKLKK